jgi:hypothetical protein
VLDTVNGIGVNAGIGVLEVVAVTPSPTVMYAASVHQTMTPCAPGGQGPKVTAEPLVLSESAGKLLSAKGLKKSMMAPYAKNFNLYKVDRYSSMILSIKFCNGVSALSHTS